MSKDYLNRREQIHINCPYCWAEFKDFEQIGGKIRYKGIIYDSFEVFPLLDIESDNFISYLNGFCDDLISISIECPECKRHYRIEFFPYHSNKNRSHADFIKYNEKNEKIFRDYTLLHKLHFFSKNKNNVSSNVNLKLFFCLFIIPIFYAISYLFIKQQYISDFLILLILLIIFSILPLYLFKTQYRYYEDLRDINTFPLLIHDNYRKSYSNTVFQKELIDQLGFFKILKKTISPNKVILAIVAILMFINFLVIGETIETSFNNLFNIYTMILLIPLLFSITIIIGIYYIIFSVVLLSTLDYYVRLIYIFKNLPLHLDPWDRHFGIEKFTKFCSIMIITSIILVFALPITISYKEVFDYLNHFIEGSDMFSITIQLFNNHFFILILIANITVLTVYFCLLYYMRKNIDNRKYELKTQIKQKIANITKKICVSNKELSEISYMKLNYEQIEKIPSIPIRYGLYLSVIYASLNIILILRSFLQN